MGVGSARGTIVGSVVRSGWAGCFVVAVGQDSDCSGTIAVVGKGAVGGVASGARMVGGSSVSL